MSRPVVLSVNGRNGSDITDERQVELGRELIRRAAVSINGAHGADASPAHRGEPAGTLYVELDQSPNFPEGFIVRTRMQVPENRNPAVTEILPQKNVVFEAVGGNGEAGARGFDGQSGMDGTAGQDATNAQDATAGTPGGNGGNAGAGTNGGDGGNGGQVRVYVDEDKTHLLLATSWEVWGGKGGTAGKHGTPGPGGKGGKGGRNFKWKEQNGYQYKCTENCEGRTTAPASSLHSITKRDPRLLLLQGINQQVSAGSNFQTTVARIAQYRPNIIRDTTGLCECSGGNGHCTGCATLPIYQERTRVEGDDGSDGQRGEKPIAPLFPGRDGRPGEGLIVVRPRTVGGVEKRYSSRYQLELVDFELEDDNADGIFEPGEHLFVRRIRVRNSGGMPSPTRETRVEFGASEYLQSIPGSEGVAHIPSILAGQTVTLPGSIKVLIRESEMSINSGQAFKVVTAIALKATMPGLNRRLDHFDFQRRVEIQYPLELQEIDHLASVATGSENRISLKVRNQSSQPFGANRASLRRAEVKISIASDAGSLLSASGIWSPEVFQTTKEVPARSTVDMFQTFKISHRAKDHSYTTVHVQFFISSPGPVPPSGRSLGELGIPMRLTQSFDLKLQISAEHAFSEEAAVLVVTNVKTPPGRFEAIGDFIRKELHLKMDVWNVSQYGGLSPQDQNKEHEEKTLNVLEEYRGRTIIFLGNRFEHFGLKEQTMMDLCESDVVGKESFAGSTFLLLGSTTGKSEKETWLKHSVFPVAYRISDITIKVKESATFQTRCALLQSISEQRISGIPTSQAYKIESHPKWFYGGPKRSVKRHSKQVQSYLRSNLPQERFWVCPVYPRIDGGRNHSGYIAVWHGLPLSRKIRATESKQLLEERNKPPRLHPFDSFNIICSLPYSLRLDILGSFERESTTGAEEMEDDKGSTASKDGMKYSDEILDAVQYSLEEDVSYEIENFLSPSATFENNSLGESAKPWNSFIIHFPCLDTILRKLEMADGAPPAVLEVLRMAIASTNPQTVVQVARSITFPIGDRRAQLKSYLTRRIDIILVRKGYDPESLKEFRITTEAKHSRFNSNKRDTKKLIEERNRQFVKVPTNEYRKGRLTTEDLVKQTELCTQSEWDARCSEFEKTKVALKKSVTRAMTQRGKMSTLKSRTVGEPFSVAEDLG